MTLDWSWNYARSLPHEQLYPRQPSYRLASCLLNMLVTLRQSLLTYWSDKQAASRPPVVPCPQLPQCKQATSHVVPFSESSRGGKLTHRRPSVRWPVTQVSLVGHCPPRHDSRHKSYSENFRIGKPSTRW